MPLQVQVHGIVGIVNPLAELLSQLGLINLHVIDNTNKYKKASNI